jgi:lipopolysaccharide/colanic/teichoic acid biosynthesis glycosyltransferase
VLATKLASLGIGYYMRRRQLYTALQLVIDVFSFMPIWAGAASLRVLLNVLTARKLSQSAPEWTTPMGFTVLLYLFISWKFELYSVPRQVRVSTFILWASENAIAVLAASVIVDFVTIQFGTGASRLFVICLVPVTLLVFLATRSLALIAIRFAKRKAYLSRVAIIGDQTNASRLLSQMEAENSASVCGVIVSEKSIEANGTESLPVLGSTLQIAELVNSNQLDEVIIINDIIPETELVRCNRVLWRMGVPVRRALNLAPKSAPSGIWPAGQTIELSTLNGVPIVDFRTPSSLSRQLRVMRLFDLALTLPFLLAVAPVFLLIALIVKLNFQGSLFTQASLVGKGGRHFTCYKFRTEHAKLNTLDREPTEDCKARTLAKFLIRYSLDELPQLYNILRGEMSLVGPRPLPARKLGPDGMSQTFFAWSEARSRVRPGLTGLWQVRGRGNLTFGDMINLDLQYIQTRSFLLDLIILLETPGALWRSSEDQLRCEDSVPSAV